MGNTLKKKKGFSMPHVYAVILILMLLVTIMTYVVPAGSYVRVDGAVDPNSFAYAEQTPVGFLGFFTSQTTQPVKTTWSRGEALAGSGGGGGGRGSMGSGRRRGRCCCPRRRSRGRTSGCRWRAE